MEAYKLIREIMVNKGVSYNTLAQKLGYKTSSYVSNRIARSNRMIIDNFIEMLDAMDCEIIIKNKIGKKEQWVLTSESEAE